MRRLLDVEQIDGEVRAFLRDHFDVFVAWDDDESGCLVSGVEAADGRWAVKHTVSARGAAAQARAMAIHAAVAHPTLVPLVRVIAGDAGPVTIYPWIDGAPLRREPRTATMPIGEVLDAITAVIDLHAAIAAAGFVSIDFYDGNMLYDDRVHVIDVDEYQPMPYVLDAERALGSTRFMAPEELVRGATLDQRTTVFQMGRAAAVLVDPPLGADASRVSPAVRTVIDRATAPAAGDRFQTVAELLAEWNRVRTHTHSLRG